MEQPVMIVAGASRGLGAAAALAAARLGARLVLAARNLEGLEETARQIRQSGGQAVVVRADMTQVEDCQRVINQALHHYGKINALVNNMGMIEPIARLENTHADDWKENLSVNLIAPAIMIQAALPYLRETRGRVINVSSGAAEKPFAGWGAYCAAKAGLNMLTRVLAEEEPDLTALAVKPGVVDTEMQATVRSAGKKSMPEESHAYFVNLFEKGKLLPPDVPGRVLAALALRAPHEWSGECLLWNDEKVKVLLAGN